MTRDEAIQALLEQWLRKADRDALTATREMSFDDPITESVCFHCQQAVEKLLKAFLVAHQIHFPKTHRIAELVRLCATVDVVFATDLPGVDDLTDYAVEVRYPDMGSEPSLTEAEQAIEMVQQVRSLVVDRIGHDRA